MPTLQAYKLRRAFPAACIFPTRRGQTRNVMRLDPLLKGDNFVEGVLSRQHVCRPEPRKFLRRGWHSVGENIFALYLTSYFTELESRRLS